MPSKIVPSSSASSAGPRSPIRGSTIALARGLGGAGGKCPAAAFGTRRGSPPMELGTAIEPPARPHGTGAPAAQDRFKGRPKPSRAPAPGRFAEPPGSGYRRAMRLSLERAQQIAATRRFGDRKSTRLNSSHLVISYAVFCLKKKKKCSINNYITQIIQTSHGI